MLLHNIGEARDDDANAHAHTHTDRHRLVRIFTPPPPPLVLQVMTVVSRGHINSGTEPSGMFPTASDTSVGEPAWH